MYMRKGFVSSRDKSRCIVSVSEILTVESRLFAMVLHIHAKHAIPPVPQTHTSYAILWQEDDGASSCSLTDYRPNSPERLSPNQEVPNKEASKKKQEPA